MKNLLRELRQARGLSQNDLAQALLVSRQTVNAIENGRYDPSLPLAFAIAALFCLKIEDIFHPDPTRNESRPSPIMDEHQ